MSGVDGRPAAADAIDLTVPLIVGFGVTGRAVAEVLTARSVRPTVIDDRPSPEAIDHADQLGLDLLVAPTARELDAVMDRATVMLPSPGVPDHHPAFTSAAIHGVPIRSEFDLAAMWDDRPIVAITGTNGKTSVTMLVTEALEASGVHAAAVGNTPTPLIAALADPTVEVFVVEASSFRLGHSHAFAPTVATWLNFAPDHLDAHADLDAYLAAKASIWSHLPDGATVVANAEDPVVMAAVPPGADVVTFGVHRGDWRVQNGQLVGPDGPLISVGELARKRPHDLANATSCAATAVAAGATPVGVACALRSFEGLPHRMAHIGTWNDVGWFDDSKATVPQATLAAVGGFDSVVLIAGGANKGLDLTGLSETVPPVHSVVAIGAAADEVAAAFETTTADVRSATSMEHAVDLAAHLARPGDAVLLSPACTSYDWYDDYGQRGDHFASLVIERFTS